MPSDCSPENTCGALAGVVGGVLGWLIAHLGQVQLLQQRADHALSGRRNPSPGMSAGCQPGRLRGPVSRMPRRCGSAGSPPSGLGMKTGPTSNSAMRGRMRALRSAVSSSPATRLWRRAVRSLVIGLTRRR